MSSGATTTSVRRRRGRPNLPGKAKYIRLRDSVFQLWRTRKESLGFAKTTDSAFAELLLHWSPERGQEQPRNIELDEAEDDELGDISEDDEPSPPLLMSTPIRLVTAGTKHIPESSSRSSAHDVSGISGIYKPQSMQSRGPIRSWLANESANMPPFQDDGEGQSDQSTEEESCSDVDEKMNAILAHLSLSDYDSSFSESDDESEVSNTEEPMVSECISQKSMDISDADEERTVTMIDPMYGEETAPEQPSPLPAEESSQKTEDNTEKLVESLNAAFTELSATKGLEAYVALHSKLRVMVSVDKLLELHGSKCSTSSCEEALDYHVDNCGARVTITWKCKAGHYKKWVSSEVLTVKGNNAVYLSDCLQAAAIIVSGNNYSKFALLAKALNLQVIGSDSYLRFQKHCALPVVKDVWNNMNQLIINILKDYEDVCLCGDGRNDSPGHSARYCVYTLMEHASKVVVDFEILDSRETGGNSTTMEKEGLRRLLERLSAVLPFTELATDASSTIIKLVKDMKDKLPQLMELFHSLDIWHKAKKLNKSLHQAASLKGCEKIKPWIESIVNHFWYCCQSCEGSVEELKDSWFGVLHHVCGEHSWAGGKCKHGPEAAKEKADKEYLTKSSKEMAALRPVIMDKNWLNHFSFYVRFRHTSDLESYNSMMTKYAPKRMAFEYPYFILRVVLAAIDHNMHLHREVKKASSGAERAHRKFSKRTKHYHAEPVKEEKTYDYFPFLVSKMLKERCEFKGSFTQPRDDNEFDPKQIAPNLGMKEAPPTEELKKGPTRFLKDSKQTEDNSQ